MLDAFAVKLDTVDAVFDKSVTGIMQQPHRIQKIVDHHRLENVQFEIALRAGKPNGRVISKDLNRYHRDRLALCRVDLAGHDRASRLVLGQRDLTDPASWTGCKPAY